MKKLVLLFSVIICPFISAQNIVLQEFATGFSNPVEIVNANDNRLFVVQQNGIIKILQPNGTTNATNFLNISSKITFGGERGLLGLAFHPQYATNGYFFVYYNNLVGDITLERYTVNSTDPDIADATSNKLLLNISKPFTNHNGGSLHFAPDGYLWISTGDGGSGGDPNNNAQNKNSLLGKMLRIDVNTTGTYSIPADNPFVGTTGADEIWSFGLRNGWKYSFDLTAGKVIIADVGQGLYEEINQMPITQAGINYGWRCYEGNNIYNASGCAASSTMTFPLAVYDHSGGKCSITGGYVYRGNLYPAMNGRYFFADYCSKQIGMLNADNSITWTTAYTGNSFATFGQDVNKELYVAAVNNGKIFKISFPSLSTENIEEYTIKMYPNPANKNVFVANLKSKNNSAEIFNAEGRKVLDVRVKQDGSIDISTLLPGIYFVNIKSSEVKIYSQKLIVK